jgi:hypothetical protein
MISQLAPAELKQLFLGNLTPLKAAIRAQVCVTGNVFIAFWT